MENATIFYAIKLLDAEEKMQELTEHLAMNGYTYDTNGENVLFVYDEEVNYVLTIIEDRDIEYEIL